MLTRASKGIGRTKSKNREKSEEEWSQLHGDGLVSLTTRHEWRLGGKRIGRRHNRFDLWRSASKLYVYSRQSEKLYEVSLVAARKVRRGKLEVRWLAFIPHLQLVPGLYEHLDEQDLFFGIDQKKTHTVLVSRLVLATCGINVRWSRRLKWKERMVAHHLRARKTFDDRLANLAEQSEWYHERRQHAHEDEPCDLLGPDLDGLPARPLDIHPNDRWIGDVAALLLEGATLPPVFTHGTHHPTDLSRWGSPHLRQEYNRVFMPLLPVSTRPTSAHRNELQEETMPEHAIHNPEPANFDDILKTHRECFDGARARLDEVMQEPFPLDFVSGRPDPKLIDWLEEMTARTQQAAHEADMAWRKLQVLEGVSSHLHRATGS